jgi:microsomal dipeptidase-like Zn-dependent dipeptidase
MTARFANAVAAHPEPHAGAGDGSQDFGAEFQRHPCAHRQNVERRAGDPAQVSALLAIEGLHALDGKLESVDTLYAAGFRMMGLTHFFDNEVAASAHGVTHAGLTPLGRQVVARMEALGIIVDLAHSSAQTVQEVLAMATRPVVVSHTGVAATCPGPRNLTDDQLRAIAATGGLVGIGYWDGAVCEPTVANIAKAIQHAVRVAGAAQPALGRRQTRRHASHFERAFQGVEIHPVAWVHRDLNDFQAKLLNLLQHAEVARRLYRHDVARFCNRAQAKRQRLRSTTGRDEGIWRNLRAPIERKLRQLPSERIASRWHVVAHASRPRASCHCGHNSVQLQYRQIFLTRICRTKRYRLRQSRSIEDPFLQTPNLDHRRRTRGA